MSNIWAKNPDLFLYTKGNDVYLWRCTKTTWMPMVSEDFDVVAEITDHQALIGEDSLFDWDKKYYDGLIAYISPRRLLVNSRGLVIAELRKFSLDGKLDENDQQPFYMRSLDVMSLKPFNLRDRIVPSRTVRYLGGEGRAAPVAAEDSTVPPTGKTITSNDDHEKRVALEKQVAELTTANKTLKSEKEAAEKQATELNDKNKKLAEDVAEHKTAGEKAQQELDVANRDKKAAERTANDLQTQIDNKKEGWMNDLSESGWSDTQSLQRYIHGSASGGHTTFRVHVVGERGNFTVDDNTTNVRASYIYRVKIIDYAGNFSTNLQRATKEYKAVKLEDLNPSKEKARFSSSNWVRGMYDGDTYVIKEL